MTVYDAPDYQKVVTTVTATGPVDAPDWERVVVSPGGAPIGGGAWSQAFPSQTLQLVNGVSGDVSLGLGQEVLPAGTYLVWANCVGQDTSGGLNGFGLRISAAGAGNLTVLEGVGTGIMPANGYGTTTAMSVVVMTARDSVHVYGSCQESCRLGLQPSSSALEVGSYFAAVGIG